MDQNRFAAVDAFVRCRLSNHELASSPGPVKTNDTQPTRNLDQRGRGYRRDTLNLFTHRPAEAIGGAMVEFTLPRDPPLELT
ncbi:MAG: hypothetical protein AB7U97_19090, partial [Pirellulales bacterium]